MGQSDLHLINRLKAGGYFPEGQRSIVEIGAQQLNDNFLTDEADVKETRKLFGIKSPKPTFARTGTRDAGNSLHGAPLARDFWVWLGFDYASIDIDGTSGSIPLDLNFDEAPESAIGKYHLVTNLGTTEHAANQMQAFKIIHDLAAVNGVMVHNVPMAGMLSHGLISYNPKFFWTLARANGYKIVFMTLSKNAELQPLPESIMGEISKNDSSAAERFSDYRSCECAIVLVMQKMFDAPFVPPLDVNGDATIDHVELKSRYWSMFESDPFAKREEALEARKRAVFDREQALAAREGVLWVSKFFGKGLMRSRKWAYQHAPMWVVRLKRRMFGATGAQP